VVAEGVGLFSSVEGLESWCGTAILAGMFAATGARVVAVDLSSDLIGTPSAKIAHTVRRFP
jgi:2-polyprenyl-3-methyl-5-hydroxy-6-metoxy-1,4-benzoquinol methylase